MAFSGNAPGAAIEIHESGSLVRFQERRGAETGKKSSSVGLRVRKRGLPAAGL